MGSDAVESCMVGGIAEPLALRYLYLDDRSTERKRMQLDFIHL